MKKNYFKIFKIPQSIDVNKKKLIKKFYLLQKKYHPDMNVDKFKKKKKFLEKSILINKGYNILKNFFKRAQYILKINNKKSKKIIFSNSYFLNNQIKLYKKLNKIKKLKKNKFFKLKKFLKKIKKKIFILKKKLRNYILKKKWKKSNLKISKIFFLKKFKKILEIEYIFIKK